MRNISFALTTEQFRNRTKTVTRRLGWRNLLPGTVLMGCEKCQGIQKGGLVRLGPIKIESVNRQPLIRIRDYPNDCALEGFPDMTPDEFIEMFCAHMRCEPKTVITRIRFSYIDE